MDLAFYEAIGRPRARRSRGSARRRLDLVSWFYAAAAPKPKTRKGKRPKKMHYRDYEVVCQCGPYIRGFYNVKNVGGKATMIRRSAAAMRKFALKRDPCIQRG